MRITLATCLAILSLAGLARADVLVVDGGGGPGHHATIQAAVDAANVGDTILVDPTLDASQESVLIDGKGFHLLVAAQDTDTVIKKLTVRNLPAGQQLTLRGLRVVAPAGVGMEFLDNAGTLRLYDVRAVGKQGLPQTTSQIARAGSTGVLFTNCADVMLMMCGFGGGDGGSIATGADLATSDGGTGGVVENSKLSAWLTPFVGGHGGNVQIGASEAAGGTGGTGLVNEGSTLFFYGLGAGGGQGGNTALADGAPGGAGLVQSGAAARFDTYNTGGTGGTGGLTGLANDGPDGADEVILGGTRAELGAVQTWARELWTTTPVREGEPIAVTSTGFEDHVWMLVSFDTGHQLLPGYQGALMLGTPFFGGLHYLGYVPFIAVTFPLGTVPALPPGVDVFELQVQAVMQVGGAGFMLGTPEHIVLLDSAY